jgi:hypothetical protein
MVEEDAPEANVELTEPAIRPQIAEGCAGCRARTPVAGIAQHSEHLQRRRLLIRTALAAGAGFIVRFLPPGARLPFHVGTQFAGAQEGPCSAGESYYCCYPCGTRNNCSYILSYPAYCCGACDSANCSYNNTAYDWTCYQLQYDGCQGNYATCGPVDCTGYTGMGCGPCDCHFTGYYCAVG